MWQNWNYSWLQISGSSHINFCKISNINKNGFALNEIFHNKKIFASWAVCFFLIKSETHTFEDSTWNIDFSLVLKNASSYYFIYIFNLWGDILLSQFQKMHFLISLALAVKMIKISISSANLTISTISESASHPSWMQFSWLLASF